MSAILPRRLRLLAAGVSRARHPRCLTTRAKTRPGQAFPRGPFYDAVMEYNLPPQDHSGHRRIPPSQAPPQKPPPGSPPPAEPPAKPTKASQRRKKTETPAKAAAPPGAQPETAPAETPAERARIVFGSSLAGPARRADLRSKGTLVAGVLVPPKPDEPDNCCMSGCVNCVWDQYREDMEEYIVASAEADRRTAARQGDEEEAPESMSVDDDGGGREAGWSVEPQRLAKDFWDDELYKDLPVGIREFMKQEKKLKERHAKQGTTGG